MRKTKKVKTRKKTILINEKDKYIKPIRIPFLIRVILSVLITLIPLYFLFKPNVKIIYDEALDKSNPFYNSFYLENNSISIIEDIEFVTTLHNVKTNYGLKLGRINVRPIHNYIRRIEPNKKSWLNIENNSQFTSPETITSGAVIIHLTYYYKWIGILQLKYEDNFRFSLVRKNNKEPYWIEDYNNVKDNELILRLDEAIIDSINPPIDSIKIH